MMEERVILTDFYDNPIGSGSKKECACRGGLCSWCLAPSLM